MPPEILKPCIKLSGQRSITHNTHWVKYNFLQVMGETIALVLQIPIIGLINKNLETRSFLPLKKSWILSAQSPQTLPGIIHLSWVLPRGSLPLTSCLKLREGNLMFFLKT